jgi:predicted nucleic-acid-binding Zn-ribbon protein
MNQEEPLVGRFFTAARRAVEAMGEAPTGERYVVAGKAVSCGHCGSDRFVEGRAQLNTAGLSFLNLDWANRSAATLACTSCGHIEWFLADPEEV